MNDLLKPVNLFPNLCPRAVYGDAPSYGYRRCAKPLTDYKCPVHGLIREVMPK